MDEFAICVCNVSVDCVQELVAAGRERLQSLLDLQARTTMEYDKTVRYFGEDPRTTRSDEFFAVFHQFLEIFEVLVCVDYFGV